MAGSYLRLRIGRWDRWYALSLHVEYAERRKNTVFNAQVACFMNTVTLYMYVSMLYTGLHRWNMLFVFLWLRHRTT